MAESFADKTEAPTPRRRQEAREEGNVTRSADLSSADAADAMVKTVVAEGGPLHGLFYSAGESVLIRCGKSTLLKILSGKDTVDEGT